MCSSNAIYSMSPVNGNTITWSIAPAISGSSYSIVNNNLVVNWIGAASSVSHTITAAWLGGACSSTYIVQPCCSSVPNTVANIADLTNPATLVNLLPAGSVTSSTFVGVTTYTISNTDFNIQGVFLIPGTARVIFNKCHVYMGPGSIISVPSSNPSSGISITNGCIFESMNTCSPKKMWQGIDASPGEQVHLEIFNSVVMDAQFAVKTGIKNPVVLDGAEFYRNYISVITPDFAYPNTPSHFLNLTIRDCIFDGQQLLVDNYLGQTPPPIDHKTYAGIYLSRVRNFNLDIPEVVSSFQNINAGIILDRCIGIISHCNFNNVQPNGSYNSLIGSGCAIYAETNSSYAFPVSLDVGTPSISNNFNNCRTGIYVKNRIPTNILNNSFISTTETAIKMLSNSYQPISIRNNFYEDAINAIDLTGCQGPGGIIIENNTINRVMNAINIKGCKYSDISINDNPQITNFRRGITIENSQYSNISIFRNIMSSNFYGSVLNNFSHTAIYVTNPSLMENTIDISTNTISDSRIGIYLSSINNSALTYSGFTHVKENTIDFS